MIERFSYQGLQNKGEIFWASIGEIHACDHSVDLVVKTSHPSFEYETYCFNVMSNSLAQNQFAIGPHLADFLFEHEGIGSFIRPDGIIFSADEHQWIIESLIEIRTGKLGLRRKLNGFSKLLSEFRQYPTLLPNILRRGIGEEYETPDTILIPEDTDITVLFIHPKERTSATENLAPTFPVIHKQIKMMKQHARLQSTYKYSQ